MLKFSVSNSWGQNSETIKFKTIHGNLNGPKNEISPNKIKNKKKKNKTKAKSVEADAAKKTTTAKAAKKVVAATTTPKVKAGRIAKKAAGKQKKLQLTPALAKAAAATIVEKKTAASTSSSNSGDNATLQSRLQQELMGGRFRYLNEQLYTMSSRKAAALFREDGDAFSAYHAGYRHQVEKWPLNPLDRIIKMIRRLPKTLEIGDFGCGEGALAKAVPNKVFSMDLVSSRDDIIACDMAKTPLPAESLDIAVYCLSLMGTNLKDYIIEANRVLRMGGLIFIAEIQSRFEDARQFVRCLQAAGFELVKKDVGVQLFYFFQFRKVRNTGKVVVLPDFSLKPCMYRKR